MPVVDKKSPLIRIVSHNVQGINSPIKRKLFKLYHKSGMLLLQETHFPRPYNPSFLHQHFPQFYLSNVENKTKGVAICFSKHLNFAMLLFYMSHVFKDPSGRYILVKGTIDGTLYSFVSYYSTNKAQDKFFSSMMQSLSSQLEGAIVLGGDSNIAFDLALDKSWTGPPRSKWPPNIV